MGHEESGSSPCGAHGERPVEPDHPMSLEGEVTHGDTEFMVRCLFEEYLRGGYSVAELREMARDDQYQALAAARHVLGDARIDALLADTVACVGVHRISTWERAMGLPTCPSAGSLGECERCPDARGD